MQLIPMWQAGFPKAITVFLRVIAVLLSFCFVLRSFGEAQPQPRRVLILNEAGTAWPGIVLIDQGIRAALDASPYKLEFYREYMDTILFPGPADQERFQQFFIRKYQNRKPDVIITVGPSPLKFMVETHKKTYPGVPIVFCLPNWIPGTPSLDSDFTGVENKVAAWETIESALRLQPDTRNIVVVAGIAFSDRQYLGAVKEQLRGYEDNFVISYATDLNMPNLLERLKHLPNHTIVLFTAFSEDTEGSKFTTGGASALVAAAANAPVFALQDVALEHGEVGGKLASLRDQGRIAGDLALRILKGEKPQVVGRVVSPAIYMFDWRALKRWGFKESQLPPGSIILHRQVTFWESYKWYVISGISLIVFEALLIFGLLWQRARRARAEGELRESEARFRSLADTAPVLIWMSGTDRLCTYVNRSWLDFTGRSMEQELGNGWTERVHPDDLQGCLDTYIQAFDRREKLRMEYRIQRYDGEYRWLLDVGVPRFQGSSFAGYIGCALDVTERKSMEKLVQESEERLRLAAQAGRMFAYSWNAQTDGIERSGESANILGIETEQASTGAAISAMVHPEDKERLEAALAKLTVDEPNLQITYRIIRPDGTIAWLERNSCAHFNERGDLQRIVGMIVDVTERKLSEEALASVSRRLIQAQEQERVRIARELHDDINQRISMLAIDLNKLGQHPPESATALTSSVDEMVRCLSDISGEVQGMSHRLHSSKLEYLGLVAACRGFSEEVAERQNVTIEFRADGVPSCMPQDVSLAIFRVLQESLQNAIKHSGTHNFSVQLRGLSGELQLIVHDDGVGFDVEQAIGNHGIGLISMRERVSLVKGEISITSKPGTGTEIRVRVPMPATNTSQETASHAA